MPIGDLQRRCDHDQIVIETRCRASRAARGPLRHLRARRNGRIGDRHGITLRSQEFAEPATHLAGAADDQRCAPAATSAGGDANAFLRGQEPRISRRSTDSASDGETPSDAAAARACSSTSRSRRKSRVGAAFRAFHFGDLATERLPLGDERQQLTVERAQTFA